MDSPAGGTQTLVRGLITWYYVFPTPHWGRYTHTRRSAVHNAPSLAASDVIAQLKIRAGLGLSISGTCAGRTNLGWTIGCAKAHPSILLPPQIMGAEGRESDGPLFKSLSSATSYSNFHSVLPNYSVDEMVWRGGPPLPFPPDIPDWILPETPPEKCARQRANATNRDEYLATESGPSTVQRTNAG